MAGCGEFSAKLSLNLITEAWCTPPHSQTEHACGVNGWRQFSTSKNVRSFEWNCKIPYSQRTLKIL